MSEKVLLIVHQETSDPGRVGAALKARGYALELRRPALGDTLPKTLDGYTGSVIFGGPMSANDDHLPFIRAEIDWIAVALASGKPFLGICLGAQMLCRALGGKVSSHPDGWHEIGYFPIRPTAEGRFLFPEAYAEGLCAYEWHGEGFDVPHGAEPLASGHYFPNQAFRYGRAYAIQFHPEVTAKMMRLWTVRAAHRLVLPGAQSREAQIETGDRVDADVGRWLDGFFDHWLATPAATESPAPHPLAKTPARPRRLAAGLA